MSVQSIPYRMGEKLLGKQQLFCVGYFFCLKVYAIFQQRSILQRRLRMFHKRSGYVKRIRDNVIPASGGESCLKKLHKVQPDVLICDVMMPGIDGFELTKRVKNDIETSHIPVILLTARTSDDIRLEGYETGADAYLTKPFKMDILEARVRNLIEERQKRISSFSSDSDIKPANVAVNSLDEKLMDRIMESIQKNLDNPEYSVEELSSDVGMHRMNLYRKLQSLVGMTPSEFIRTIRLKRAAQILAERPDISVTELADMVGFNTPKYLTRYFKEMFGCTPSQYARK